MDTLLRVKDWNEHYENNRTRSMKNTSWVPIKNKHDNEGYITLVAHEKGAQHLGGWIGIVQVASKCHPRGTLLRKDGTPHTPESLSLITRLPDSVFAEVIPRLMAIGWLESVTCQVPAANPQDGAGSTQASDGEMTFTAQSIDEEQNRKRIRSEGEAIAHAADSFAPELHETEQEADKHSDWDSFRSAYPEPKRNNRIEPACRAYVGRIDGKPGEHERLMAGLQRHLVSDQWVRSLRDDAGRFIPSMEKFIVDGLYSDHPPVYRQATERGQTEQSAAIAEMYRDLKIEQEKERL